jgi:osomolarity two-component system response regulator SSK1
MLMLCQIDNVVNQEVVAAFLHKMNIRFDVASNGKEVIQKWQSGVFHIILVTFGVSSPSP